MGIGEPINDATDIAVRAVAYCDTKEKLGEVIELLKEIQDNFDEHFKPRG